MTTPYSDTKHTPAYDDPYSPTNRMPTPSYHEDAPFDHNSIAKTGLARGATISRKPSDAGKSTTTDGNRLTYYDEDFNHYSNAGKLEEQPYDNPTAPLTRNAAQPGQRASLQGMEYEDPYDPTNVKPAGEEKRGLFSSLASKGRYPIEQRIEDKKRGIGRQRYPFVVYALSIIMLGVFIKELVTNAQAQGSPFSFKPVVNYMLGPSSSALINLGARFPPCMKDVQGIPSTLQMGCMNNTANPPDKLCTIEDLCGFGGFKGGEPNQWFRFITPIFLHAGLIHFLLNMLAQLSLSAQIEREMGSGGFILTYIAAGIFGNVLGGNFSLAGIPSVGASGAIFGTVAITWVDLVAHWKYHYRPVRRLVLQTIELLIGIAVGYIPYVDNFAHIGGFVMGLFVGTIFYPIISESKRHRLITWSFRVAAIPVAVLLFVLLIRNFYTSDPYAACSGCRYLSCFPTASNNHCKGNGLTTTTTTT